ncbi:M13-type metalloendopeptidase [Caballeronia choica]|uniref:M13-type metalloendopeptidase n=1 Tax=Caballeronia choica TaxID=326476 RepID=UPI0035B538E6
MPDRPRLPVSNKVRHERIQVFDYGHCGRHAYARRVWQISHAPGKSRANGPVSNTPSFAAPFACKPGSPMARTQEDRVTI